MPKFKASERLRIPGRFKFVLADPQGSILCDYVNTGSFGEAGSWAVEGIGEDFVPAIADLSLVKHAYSISDQASFGAARDLLRAEGILAGSSTGTLLAAALQYCREQTTPKRVVTFVCDTGTRYLSKVYNEQWLVEQGLVSRTNYGDLRDLIARRYEDGTVISVLPSDSLKTAFQRMRYAEISQLPVIADDQIVGLIDESDRACKNFCVNGHPAGNCHIARSDDDRRKESSTQGVTG